MYEARPEYMNCCPASVLTFDNKMVLTVRAMNSGTAKEMIMKGNRVVYYDCIMYKNYFNERRLTTYQQPWLKSERMCQGC